MYDYKTGQSRSDNFIDEQDKFDYYDYLSEVTYLNLKHYAITDKGIYFNDIDINNKAHKFLLHIALRVAIFDDKIHVHIPNLNIFKFYDFIIKEFGFKEIKYFGRSKLKIIDPNSLLNFEAEGNQVDINIFNDIYSNYYEKGGTIYAL